MLLFQCTKDATEALTATRKGVTESWVDEQPMPPDDPPWVWQLHAVKIARQNVLVAMQADTRFVMIFWGIKKGDGETLIRLFWERLVNHLIWLVQDASALDEAQLNAMVDCLIEAHQRFAFRSGSDRSVQTHINEVVHCCRGAVEDNGGLPEDEEQAAWFDEDMNRMLRRARGSEYFYPGEEMLCAALRDFAGMDEAGVQQVRERLRMAKRQDMAEALLQHAELIDPQENDAKQALIEQLLAQAYKGKNSLH